ncbi:MAG: cbb3-type cytochrome c oxidase subunit I [Firmicutes bacterium]|nr:cbb3-type cytochrome c oxidase subunit I [Bacillota bacterium]
MATQPVTVPAPVRRSWALTPRSVVSICLSTSFVLIYVLGMVGGIMRANQAAVVHLPLDTFYSLLTLHGTGMIALVTLAMAAGLWYAVHDILDLRPRVLMVGFALFCLGIVLVLVATLVGGFAAGWTFLYPLPFVNTTWPAWATLAFLLGVLAVGLGFSIYCMDILTAVVGRYGGLLRGLGLDALIPALGRPGQEVAPPPVIAATMVGIDGAIGTLAGAVILIALLAHYVNPAFPIDALWAKNVTYFFGHIIANLDIYLAAGTIYAYLPTYAGREWKTNGVLALSWVGSLVFVLTAYGHHLYMDFVQPPALQFLGESTSYLASVPPAVVTIFGAVLLVYRSGIRWHVGSVLLYAGLVGWAVGGTAAELDASIPFNFVLHNTLWVVAHFHTYLLGGAFLFAIAFASHFAGEREAMSGWARAGLWLLLGGITLFLASFYVSGLEGVPRREAIQPAPGPVLSLYATAAVAVLLAGLTLVLLDVWHRARRSRAFPEEAA